MNIDALKALCDPRSDRAITQEPHAVHHNGEEWSFGTNGHAILAIRAELGLPGSGKLKSLPDTVFGRTDDCFDTTAQALREWAGDPRWPAGCVQCSGTGWVTCGECGGNGTTIKECDLGHEHETDCDECNNGRQVCHEHNAARIQSFGRINGAVVNRVYVARLLAYVDGVTTVYTDGAAGVIRFVGEGWIAAVMPLIHYDDKKELPEFTNSQGGSHVN